MSHPSFHSDAKIREKNIPNGKANIEAKEEARKAIVDFLHTAPGEASQKAIIAASAAAKAAIWAEVDAI